MIKPYPKPLPKKKPKHRQDPFPQAAKDKINQRQNGICAHPGCNKPIDEYHHVKRKGMGGSKHPDRHNPRYGVGLCEWHHVPIVHCGGKAEIYWRKYWEEYCEKEEGKWKVF